MKFTRTCIAFAGAIIVMSMSSQSATKAAAEPTAQPKQSQIDSANRLFEAGKFAEACKLYSQIVAKNPKDLSAIVQLGRIALLSNRLDDAQKWLEKAVDHSGPRELRPGIALVGLHMSRNRPPQP